MQRSGLSLLITMDPMNHNTLGLNCSLITLNLLIASTLYPLFSSCSLIWPF